MLIEARFLTTDNVLVIDNHTFPIYEIDKNAVLDTTNTTRIAVFVEPDTDNALLFRPYEFVNICN